MWLLAGTLSAAMAWVFNACLLARFGNKAIITLAPLLEEGFKTGLASWFSTSIVGTHLVFGATEAVFELLGKKANLKAALVALTGHTLFGVLTWWAYIAFGSFFPALMAGSMVHLAWNFLIVALHRRP
ncbi:MAG: hypothetical protein PWP65_44 [Clostridia bacterium]|nr:hypothetical protein [Clostridia bacterium]